MPKLDGTGPLGQGQQTGRGLGDCLGKNSYSEVTNSETLTKDEKKELLLREKDLIEKELSRLENN
jgi:hypothetical protein